MGEPVDTSAETVLVRFGLQWNGPREFVSTPMADGYWTPWHVADSALNAAQQRIADLEALLTERNRLREALGFYANPRSYEPYDDGYDMGDPAVMIDEGWIARAAMAAKEAG